MTVLAGPGRAGTGLAGTRTLTALAVRRDRIGLAAGTVRDRPGRPAPPRHRLSF
ncbi:MAG: hypothetical protein ACRDP5_17095 [Streptosporangiaceae bacterium]